jgi:sugar lactone lactonase YvrE/enterochelin esterase-like enzyme
MSSPKPPLQKTFRNQAGYWGTLLLAALAAVSQPASMPAAKAQKAQPPAKAEAVPPGDDYQPGPDSQRQPGVPEGKMFQFKFTNSKFFPGTSRNITVYVPAQYRGDKPACVYIGLDSLGFGAPIVFDNLIHRRQMPLIIGIGISPGQADSTRPAMNPRLNRTFEFDGLNDSLARCILEELLPEVEKQKTPDGLPILLSKDPNDRCVGGGSTGGIAAFTLAWERPDAFRRVFTAIGTFVGMRGGDRYPVLVRKTEPKPLRIFMQDGTNDQWMGGPEVGDWWMSNQTMERALTFAGYAVEHAWGTGPHSGRHATAIFPDAIRWLWKDWPQPIMPGISSSTVLKAILLPGENWQLSAEGYPSADDLAANPQGEVFFRDAQKTYKISADAMVGEYSAVVGKECGLAFGPDGRLYTAESATARIMAYEGGGRSSVIAAGIRGRHLTVTHNGFIYITEPGEGEAPSKVWLIKPAGEKTVLDSGLNHASGLALTPDGLWLCVVENRTHFGYSWRVLPDGSLDIKQRFYWFHVPDWADDSGAGSVCMDREGRMYAATRMGVQVFDRNGRSRAILSLPGGEVTSVCFGGANFDMLYATCRSQVYRRKLKTAGAPQWAAPFKLPPGNAG